MPKRKVKGKILIGRSLYTLALVATREMKNYFFEVGREKSTTEIMKSH